MIYVGIDPGKSGGIAVLTISHAEPTVEVCPMPEEIGPLYVKLTIEVPSSALYVLEQVHASTQMGVTSAFTFGRGVGQIEGILVKRNVRIVTPQKWQTALNCLTKGDKKISLAKAKELFPNQKGITLKTADALLLAYYGMVQHG